jgi:Tol biopolymer transport system component
MTAHSIRIGAMTLSLALALAAPAWAAKDDVDLVSRATGAAGAKSNGLSWTPSISADGRLIAFQSEASNLHPDDPDDGRDVFVRDLEANTTELVSRAAGATGVKANGESDPPAISADGRFVAFASGASNLHPDDTDATWDIFVRDLETDTVTLASRATGAAGAKSNGDAGYAAISADGRYVAFSSEATNLDPGDTDSTDDVYVRDLQTSTTTLVSRATGAAGTKGDGYSYEPALSADGARVAFISQATNLHPDDGDGNPSVFVRDLRTSTTTLASRASGVAGANADGGSLRPDISADGRVVAFMSQSDNLDPGDDGDRDQDVFVRDLEAHTTTLVSRADGAAGASADDYSAEPVLSADGRLVAFESEGENLHPDDTDGRYDVFVRDVAANTTTLVSRDRAGAKGNGYSYHATMTPDGRYVAFASAATNLHADDGDGELDVFRRDVLGVPPDVPSAPAGPATTTDIVPQAGGAPTVAEPAIARLRLGSSCVRRTSSGRVRVPMTMRLARPGAVRVRIDRAIGSRGRSSCPTRRRARDHDHGVTRYRRVAVVPRAAATAVAHRVMLDLRLRPGLYRITVRAVLDGGRLSRPVRRWLRVTG